LSCAIARYYFIIVIPYRASLIAKKKANQLYCYVVESARFDGKPRTAPVPLEATAVEFGLPGSLWLAAQRTCVLELLQSLWPQPRSGPSPAHYLLLAAIHRICQPFPKTEVADWYDRTILRSLWGFAPERFTSQEFWDCFDRIQEEELETGPEPSARRLETKAVGQLPAASL
jgi:hypothetical protein